MIGRWATRVVNQIDIDVLLQNPNEQTISQNSNSVWSTSSLFMPAALQVPSLPQQQLAPDGMPDCSKFAGLPSAAAMIMPEPLGPSDAPACTVPHQLARNSLVEKVRSHSVYSLWHD